MAEIRLEALSPWAGVWRQGRFGHPDGEPGVVIAEPRRCAVAQLIARKGAAAELLAAAAAAGIELPTRPAWSTARELTFIWTGVDQWLVRGLSLFSDLEAELAGFRASAVLVDQSHGRAVLAVGGERARDALAKGLEIDLHPRVFRPGDAAVTSTAGISTMLRQIDDRPTYEIAVPRSMTGSFWHWLTASSAEYGYRVGPAAA